MRSPVDVEMGHKAEKEVATPQSPKGGRTIEVHRDGALRLL